jgi:hypothetical protein
VDGDARDRMNLRDRLRRAFGRHLRRLRTCPRSLPSSPSSLPPSGLASAKASLESASLDCLSCLRWSA